MDVDVCTIRLLFTRHGETEENMKQIICGQQSGKLTKIGLEQAEKIGQYLHVEGKMFDHIYVSDLGRTMDTLERINSKAPQLKTIKTTPTKLLREKAGGVFEGKPLSAWKKGAQSEGKSIREFRVNKSENWCDVHARCFAFLQLLVREHCLHSNKPNNVVSIFAVSHGGYLMQFHNLVRVLHEKKPAILNNSAKNCSLHEFLIEYPRNVEQYKVENVRIRCLVDNFVKHLE